MSNLSVNTITNAAGGNTAQINGMTPTGLSLQGFRNRIINGGMVIDQRNNGASVTGNNTVFGVDRFITLASASSKLNAQQNAGSVTPPAGFTNYLGYTSTSSYSVGAGEIFALGQNIEGFNIADLAWGTANAQAVTVSFWVRSSLTGTFSGFVQNSDGARSYVFSYTISAANTWEQKTVTIPGDTTGTWLTTNGRGIRLFFTLAAGSSLTATAGVWNASDKYGVTGTTSVVGTSGATFYITGVQLEAGSVASPFERRPYGTELALCQRYLPAWRLSGGNEYLPGGMGFAVSSVGVQFNFQFLVQSRIPPTGVVVSGAAHFSVGDGVINYTTNSVGFLGAASNQSAGLSISVASGLTQFRPYYVFGNVASLPFLYFTGCEL